MGNNVSEYRAQGAVIIERLRETKTPSTLAPRIKRFSAAHAAYESAAARVDQDLAKRDAALEAIATADDTLDTTVDTLAAKLVGAGVAERANPFKAYSKYNPSDLKGLAYATEVAAVRQLVAAVRKKASKPGAEVTAALKACEQAAADVTKALRGLTAPQAAYNKSLAARDALLPEWQAALRKLRKFADAEMDDEPEVFAALFAPPEAVQKPVKRRAARKGDGKGASPSGSQAPAQ